MSTPQSQQDIQTILELFPEVMWDRYSGELDDLEVFGWIDRSQDAYKDFVLLVIVDGIPISISTSSAKYSAEFCKRLDFTHSDCIRVEQTFDAENIIRLSDSAVSSNDSQQELREAIKSAIPQNLYLSDMVLDSIMKKITAHDKKLLAEVREQCFPTGSTCNRWCGELYGRKSHSNTCRERRKLYKTGRKQLDAIEESL